MLPNVSIIELGCQRGRDCTGDFEALSAPGEAWLRNFCGIAAAYQRYRCDSATPDVPVAIDGAALYLYDVSSDFHLELMLKQ